MSPVRRSDATGYKTEVLISWGNIAQFAREATDSQGSAAEGSDKYRYCTIV